MINTEEYKKGYNDCKADFLHFIDNSQIIVNSNDSNYIEAFNQGYEALKDSIRVFFDESIEPEEIPEDF